MTAATLHGGPLDGHVIHRPNGSWPIYLADDGGTVTARAGDREMVHRPNGGLAARWGYTRQHARAGVQYVHHTLPASWTAP